MKDNQTKTAKEILKNIFKGTKLSNTSIVKIGKITKDVAYEIARVSNGMYMGECYLTIVSSTKDLTLDILEKVCFENLDLAEKEVKKLKLQGITHG